MLSHTHFCNGSLTFFGSLFRGYGGEPFVSLLSAEVNKAWSSIFDIDSEIVNVKSEEMTMK
jgi:predicted choloylglycine hydrolase